jgi:hypothetical protein
VIAKTRTNIATQSTALMSNLIGHLPINECYFVGGKHEGISAGRGCIVILHVPTGDVWSF